MLVNIADFFPYHTLKTSIVCVRWFPLCSPFCLLSCLRVLWWSPAPRFSTFLASTCVCVLHGFRFPGQSWLGIPPATRCHSFCLGINYKEWISRTIFTTATQIFWPCPLAWVSPIDCASVIILFKPSFPTPWTHLFLNFVLGMLPLCWFVCVGAAICSADNCMVPTTDWTAMGTAANGKHGNFGPINSINGLSKPKRGKGIKNI